MTADSPFGSQNNLDSFFELLRDEDPQVEYALAENVRRMDAVSRRILIEAWTNKFGAALPPAIQMGIRLDAKDRFCARLGQNNPNIALEECAFLISTWGRPDLPLNRAKLKLDAYAGHLSDLLPKRKIAEDPLAASRTLCKYLFQEIGFQGNEDDYYDPDNSFLAALLESRKGIPISLSVMTLLVAERIHLQLLPIGAPGRFLIAVPHDNAITYIDCHGGGRFLKDPQARRMIGKIPAAIDPLPVVDTREVLARMLRNLAEIYFKLEDSHRIDELKEMLFSAETPD